MMKVAKKYAVELDHIGLPKDALLQMPLWYHVGADPSKVQRNRSAAAKCLQNNHRISTVHDAIQLLQRLEEEEHYPANFCRCQQCAHDKDQLGCRDPHKCITAVAERLNQLKPTWNPTKHDDNDLSIENITLEEGDACFRPYPANLQLLSNFRVFTNRKWETHSQVAPQSTETQPEPLQEHRENTVWCGGYSQNPQTTTARAGGAIWYGRNSDQNRPVLLDKQKRQTA
ncbi:hypothetical protein F5880DRAFT_1467340, partial [Lentinula raphanica]